ncbi:MAG TPA: hypothetical protein VMF89_17030 [Polyangiales bacterium]|nr:hypothetical protein [Polyangiales bacterium]
MLLAALSGGCGLLGATRSSYPDGSETTLPVAETSPTEGADTATLEIEPDVPEPGALATTRAAEPVEDSSEELSYPPLEEAGGAIAAGEEATLDEDEAEESAPAEQTYDAEFSEEDVQRWTEEEAELSGPLALFSAVVLQRVRDYPKWRAKFDQQLEGRKQAGFAAQGVMRGVDDQRMVGVWLAVTDVTDAKTFFAQAWRRLGVKARVKLSRNLAAEIPPDRAGLSAAIVTLKLEELAYFRTAFDATAEARAAAGLVGYSLGQDVDDDQIIYAYLQSEQPEALKRYLSSRETRRVWKDAGVLQIQSITLLREGELMRCR